jgi:phage recombination protein Bet
MSNIETIRPNKGLVGKIADKFGVDADKLLPALKSTAFRQKDNKEITNEQMMALLIVANQYGLNPFTKEIFAYPDKGGIIPVVSVDGWSRIINENLQMDGIEFEYSPETVTHKGKICHVWIDCIIYRKDRSRPTRAREFFSEVVRELSYSCPWDSHPNRMHRHKAEIQCARIAFGFGGIYDLDEAERIIETHPPEPTSPNIGKHTSEQKEYFDQLITKNDAVGMFLFNQSVDENVFINLYHSFEKGSKGKYQGIVNNLVQQGSAQLKDLVDTIIERALAEDDLGVLENIEGLQPEAVEFILDKCDSQTAKYINSVIEQSKPH